MVAQDHLGSGFDDEFPHAARIGTATECVPREQKSVTTYAIVNRLQERLKFRRASMQITYEDCCHPCLSTLIIRR